MELNKLVFPAPSASYDSEIANYLDEDEKLLYIPKNPTKNKASAAFTSEEVKTNHKSPTSNDNSIKTTSFTTYSSKPKNTDFIPCLYLPYFENGYFSDIILIFFHGNAEDIYLAYDLLRNLKKELKVNVLAMEYPGYGIYPGETKAEKICEDSLTLFDFLEEVIKIPKEKIIIFGRSIGTGPATYVASQRKPSALILMSAYLSLKAVVTHLVGRFLSWVVADRFRNVEYITKVECPVFFLHGKMDELIPYEHSKELYKLAKKGEYWFPNKMTHNSFNILSDLLIPIDTFLDKYKIKVKLSDRSFITFPDNVFEIPSFKENKHNSGGMTSLYNKLTNNKK